MSCQTYSICNIGAFRDSYLQHCQALEMWNTINFPSTWVEKIFFFTATAQLITTK